MEPTAIDKVKSGPLRDLFCPEAMVSGKEDAGGNFALGYNAAGRKILDESIDTIRVMLESCEASGLMIYHSLGGGTGAGFGSLLLQNLSDQFDKLPKLGCTI